MSEQFSNHGGTTLAAAITSTTRPVTFTVASAANLPTLASFRVIIDAEILLVIAISGTSLTGSNAEGTTAAVHASGAAVTHVLTAGALLQAETDAGNTLLQSGGTFVNEVTFNGPLASQDTLTVNGPSTFVSPATFTGSVTFSPGGNYLTSLGNAFYSSLTMVQLQPPFIESVVANGTTGSTAYTYLVCAVAQDGTKTDTSSSLPNGQITNGNATLSSSNFNVISWDPVDNAASYNIYRAVGGSNQGQIGNTTSVTFTDTGISAQPESFNPIPTVNATGAAAFLGPVQFSSYINLLSGVGVNFTTSHASGYYEYRFIPVPGAAHASDTWCLQYNTRTVGPLGTDNWLNAFTVLALTGAVTFASPVTFSNPITISGGVTFSDQAGARTALGLGAAAVSSVGNLTEATSAVLTITGGTGAILGSGLTVQVKQASASQGGYLSNNDWTTFNSKQAALTFPLSIGNGGTGQLSATAALFALGGASLTANNTFSGTNVFPTIKVTTNGASTFNILGSGSSGDLNMSPGVFGTDPRIYIGGSTATPASVIVLDSDETLLRNTAGTTNFATFQATGLQINVPVSQGTASFSGVATFTAGSNALAASITGGGSASGLNLESGVHGTDARIFIGGTTNGSPGIFIDSPGHTYIRNLTGTTIADFSVASISLNEPVLGGMGGWQTWTPSLTAAGSMSLSSITYATTQYLRIGPLVMFELEFTVTLGGAISAFVFASAPLSCVDGNPHVLACQSVIPGGSVFNPSTGWIQAGTFVFANPTFNSTSPNFVAGVWQFRLSGTYRVA
jgi:hypothetical protein